MADSKEAKRKRKREGKAVPSTITHAAGRCSMASNRCSVPIPTPIPVLLPTPAPISAPVSSSQSTMTGWKTGVTALQQLRCVPPPHLPPPSQQLPAWGNSAALSDTLTGAPLPHGVPGAMLALPSASVLAKQPAEHGRGLRAQARGQGKEVEEQSVRSTMATWLQAVTEASERWSNGGSSGSLSAVGGGKDMMGRDICVVYERRCAVTSKKRKRVRGAGMGTEAGKAPGVSASVVREKKRGRPKMTAGKDGLLPMREDSQKRAVLLQRQERQERAERRNVSVGCASVNGEGMERLRAKLAGEKERADIALHRRVALKGAQALGGMNDGSAGWDLGKARGCVIRRETWQYSEQGTGSGLLQQAVDAVVRTTAQSAVSAAADAAAAVEIATAALACSAANTELAVTRATLMGEDMLTQKSDGEGANGSTTVVLAGPQQGPVGGSTAGSVQHEMDRGVDRGWNEEDPSVCGAVRGPDREQQHNLLQATARLSLRQGKRMFPRNESTGSHLMPSTHPSVCEANAGMARKVRAGVVEGIAPEMALSGLHSAADTRHHESDEKVEGLGAGWEDGLPSDGVRAEGACRVGAVGRKPCTLEVRGGDGQALVGKAVVGACVAGCIEEQQLPLASAAASGEESGAMQCCKCRRMRQLPPHSHLPWHVPAPAGASVPVLVQRNEMSASGVHRSGRASCNGASGHDRGVFSEAEVGKRVCKLLLQRFHCMWVEGLTCRMRRQMEEGRSHNRDNAGEKPWLWSNHAREECKAALPAAMIRAQQEIRILRQKQRKDKAPSQSSSAMNGEGDIADALMLVESKSLVSLDCPAT